MAFVDKNTESVSQDICDIIDKCLSDLGITTKNPELKRTNRPPSKSIITDMQKDLNTLIATLKTHVSKIFYLFLQHLDIFGMSWE